QQCGHDVVVISFAVHDMNETTPMVADGHLTGRYASEPTVLLVRKQTHFPVGNFTRPAQRRHGWLYSRPDFCRQHSQWRTRTVRCHREREVAYEAVAFLFQHAESFSLAREMELR